MEGMVIRSRQEIEDFFISNREREKEKRERKIEALKEKIERLTTTLIQICEKRKRAELKEQTNALPKRWKSSLDHLQDERKIQDQISESNERLLELEKELNSDELNVTSADPDSESEMVLE